MTEEADAVHFDSEVATNILRIFDDAGEYVVAVSPWLHLWGHVKNAITKAKKNGIDIFLVIRKEDNPRDNRKNDLEWLWERNITVFQAEGLHAKIYFNEKRVLLSSMNLLSSSSRNSLEIAYTLNGKDRQDQVRQYVKQSVIGIASELAAPPSASPTPAHAKAAPAHPAKPQGFCLRCKRAIDLNEGKPLCHSCYAVWTQWGDPDYIERYCHKCGQQAVTSLRNPTCYPCFAGLRKFA